MKTYKKLFSLPFIYSEDWSEIPDNVKQIINNEIVIDLKKEQIICCCWSMSTINPARSFVIVTSLRIFSKQDNIISVQNFFKNITGIEKDYWGNISISSANNSNKLFFQVVGIGALPMKELIKQLLHKCNEAYNDYHNSEFSTKVIENDFEQKLEKLFSLKQKGILTQEEYDIKKKEILDSM